MRSSIKLLKLLGNCTVNYRSNIYLHLIFNIYYLVPIATGTVITVIFCRICRFLSKWMKHKYLSREILSKPASTIISIKKKKNTQFSILIILEVQKTDVQGNFKKSMMNFAYF